MNLRIPLLFIPVIFTGSVSAQSLSLNLESIGNSDASYIVFSPAGGATLNVTFQANSVGNDFSISGSNLPDLNSDTGSITGMFTISGFGSGQGLEQGSVASSSNASLVISDGLGDTEKAHLWWNTAFTAFNTGGIEYFDMNAGSAQNLSQFTYSGEANSQLQQDFSGINSGNALISFSFASGPSSLSQLANASSPTSDSFSGQVAAIPEPSSYAAVMAGIIVLAGAALRRPRFQIPAIG